MMMRLFIISFFLEAYCWFNIAGNNGRYPVTTFVLLGGMFILAEFFLVLAGGGKLQLDRSQVILAVFIVYLVLDCLFHGVKNFTSPMINIFVFSVYIFMRRKESHGETQRSIELFSSLINVMAVYGIYQFLARMFGLPFGDLCIKGHMVEGFNWSNELFSIGANVSRSNAIFLEPSFFSQFLAVNLLLMAVKIIEKRHSAKTWVAIMLNVVAFILSFSGTGILVLLGGALLYLISEKSARELRRIFAYSLLLIVVFSILVVILSGTKGGASVIKMFIGRAQELTGAKGRSASGYIRFVSGAQVVWKIWTSSPFFLLFGSGPGTGQYYGNLYHGSIKVSGYYMAAGEYGLLGFLILLAFLAEVIKKSRKIKNRSVWVIALSLIPLISCNAALHQNYVWIVLCLININTVSDNDVRFVQEGNAE